ncbi:MAG: AraC family transcriptional regulator [Ethanoligenens sp.]
MDEAIFPTLGGERGMPVYLVDAGGESDQKPMHRVDGFPAFQVIYGVSGEGRLHFDGKDRLLPAGTGFLMFPDVPHAYEPCEHPWETHWIAFDGESVSSLLRTLGFRRYEMLYFSETRTADRILNQILQQSRTENVQNGFAYSALVYGFLVALRGVASYEPTEQRTSKLSRIQPVLHYIDTHYAQPVSLAELAELIGVSEQYLCRLFSVCLGMRPFRYLMLRRMEAAKKLLTQTDCPVYETARLCGFGNASYFGAMFKQTENISPEVFRKLHRQR